MLVPFHKMHGLTLVELMVAVLIFGILLSVGAGSFSTWTQNQQTRTGAEAILNGMQVARGEAVRRNATSIFILCDVTAGGTGSSWDVLAASATSPTAVSTACGPDSTGITGWERAQQRPAQEGSRNAVVTVTGPAGANAIGFNGMGRVVTIATVPPSTNPIIQGTNAQPISVVTVTNPKGDRSLSVTVGAGGSVRMCDPSPKLALTDPRHC